MVLRKKTRNGIAGALSVRNNSVYTYAHISYATNKTE